MDAADLYFIGGLVLVLMAVLGTMLKRLPLSTSMIYLAIGILLAPGMPGDMAIDIMRDASLIEHITEGAVLVSLFATGLKLRIPFRDRRWVLPVRLATLSMAATVMFVAILAVMLLGIAWGPAILLGAIISPTDPVLASDVQVANPHDRDHLRFGLTGEAGMNDGTAFPFVMLGLGLSGLHELGAFGLRWLLVDVLWAVAAGIAVGTILGWTVARLVLYLRQTHNEAIGMDEFLALGLIALSYGIALMIEGYGFLAVFAAGVALRRVERVDTPPALNPQKEKEAVHAGNPDVATHPDTAPAYMAKALLAFNEQIERILEIAVVVLIGTLMPAITITAAETVFVALLLFVIRPVSVLLGCRGCSINGTQKAMTAWFGVRGVGSLYYLAYALGHGLAGEDARLIADYALLTIATSIVLHGISVTPLMGMYERRRRVTAK